MGRQGESGRTGRWRLRGALVNGLLLAGALTFTAAACEAALRLFPDLLPETAAVRVHWAGIGADERAERGGMIRSDPELGFRYAPQHEGRIARTDLAFGFRTDEHGFRNPSPWPERSEIVLVGDSMAFGYGVDDEAAWSSLLSHRLGNVRLINLGLPGMAPQQYLRVLERHGMALKPELVLFALFPGNDLPDALNFQSWLDAGSPGSYLDWGFRAEGAARLLEQSRLYWFLRESWRQLGTQAESITLELPDGRLQLTPALFFPRDDREDGPEPGLSLVVETTVEALELARSRGASFLALLVPTKEHVYLPPAPDAPQRRLEVLAAALEAQGVPVLDLTPALREAAGHGERVYFEVDGHPNVRGNEIIAGAVAGRLQAGLARVDDEAKEKSIP